MLLLQSVPISVRHARTTQLQAWLSVHYASLVQPSKVLTRRAEWRNIIIMLFLDCASNCVNCTNPGNCDSCKTGYLLKADKTCEACDPNCNSCASSGAGKCDSGQCHSSYALDATEKTCGGRGNGIMYL
ncbi:hypothetical protein NP493_925g02033 [Ridgeia piscesae]|uniref:Uncharacterized protein n=1 Tax=Ridgeia piscesae TaxID=27915 RepID=A0AAD9KKG4_RIDPI|nr:hypothetical protein NP493_925g02033 [Ridgeia piscesae]